MPPRSIQTQGYAAVVVGVKEVNVATTLANDHRVDHCHAVGQ
jgi:hypothetical protein